MKSRDTLIKLHRFRADEAKAKLAGLETIRTDLERKSAELDAHLSEESRRATENDIGRYAYPTFARSIRERKAKIASSVAEIERSIAEARIQLHEAFQELKKFELAEEARQKREADHLAHLERTDSDERNMQRFARMRAIEPR